jgi:hypothetical protein
LKKLGPSLASFLKVSWLSVSLFNLSFIVRLLPVRDYMLPYLKKASPGLAREAFLITNS